MDEDREVEAIARHLWAEGVERLKEKSPGYRPDEEDAAYGWCSYVSTAKLQHKLGIRVDGGKLVGRAIVA